MLPGVARGAPRRRACSTPGRSPLAGGVAEARDDPAVMDAMTFTGYAEYDYAQKNFFYTIINQNPGISIDYKTGYEPWLYDRSVGDVRAVPAQRLRHRPPRGDPQHRLLRRPAQRLRLLHPRPGDPKYAYNEPLAYTYWLLGDNRMLAPISTVVNAHNGTATRWSPTVSFWTERNVGYKLLANQIAYEVTGSATFKANVQTIVDDLIWHQNGAGGQLPANRDRRRAVSRRAVSTTPARSATRTCSSRRRGCRR